MSPFRESVKLVLDDVKRLKKPEPLRFSYATLRCGLPPTNVNGRCRKYVEAKRIYTVGRQAEDNSLNGKETCDELLSGHEFMRTSKVKIEEALSEQKTGQEDNVKRIRMDASQRDVAEKHFPRSGFMFTSKVKAEEALREQKIENEDNIKRIRTEASHKIVKMKVAIEEEKNESRVEMLSSKVKAEEALREQKIAHEDNLKRIRREASRESVKLELAMEEEKNESSKDLTSSLKNVEYYFR